MSDVWITCRFMGDGKYGAPGCIAHGGLWVDGKGYCDASGYEVPQPTTPSGQALVESFRGHYNLRPAVIRIEREAGGERG